MGSNLNRSCCSTRCCRVEHQSCSRLEQLIRKAPVMVFMKGSPEAPRCGFSRTLMDIFKRTQVSFDSFDILTDEEVRQGLKKYSNWPTYPQVYAKGSLVGGLDIIKVNKWPFADFETCLRYLCVHIA
ncbi:unnamed protein product [Ixodes pacificus]